MEQTRKKKKKKKNINKSKIRKANYFDELRLV